MLPNPDQIREALVLPQVQGKLCSHSTRAKWVGREVGGKVFSTGVIQYLGGHAGGAPLTGFKLDPIDVLFIYPLYSLLILPPNKLLFCKKRLCLDFIRRL